MYTKYIGYIWQISIEFQKTYTDTCDKFCFRSKVDEIGGKSAELGGKQLAEFDWELGKECNESRIEDTQLALPRRVRIWVRTYLLEKALLLEFMKRSNRRLDYKILHETGEKVYLENTSMSTSVSLDGRSITGEYEAKVICKIETFLEENDLTLFFDLEEVKNAIERARNILQEF